MSAYITNYFATKATLNSRAYNTEIAMVVTLNNGTKLYWATDAITVDTLSVGTSSVAITPLVFTSRISGAPEIRHSQGKVMDASEIRVINLDYIVTQAIPDPARLYDNADITIYLCFPKPSGTYEGMTYFIGKLSDLSGDDLEATFANQSDIAIKTGMLGKEVTQRCVNDLGDAWCSVNNLPINAVCSKLQDDADAGCIFWGGVFNGVGYINPTGLITGYSGPLPPDGGGGPWDTGTGRDCPDYETTWFRSDDGDIHAKQLKRGDILMNRETPVIVEEVLKVWAEYRYEVQTGIGVGLRNSASHHFLTGLDDEKGRAASEINFAKHDLVARVRNIRQLVKRYDEDEHKNYLFTPIRAGWVLRIHTTFPNMYDCGMEKGKYLENHNTKAIAQQVTQY